MNTTTVFHKTVIAAKQSDLIINQGGSSSSKTYSALQLLLLLIRSDKKGDVTSVVAESLPHIKRGALRDFTNICEQNPGYSAGLTFNKTDMFYETGSGARLEFFSADNPDKLRGARRKRLFINECNNIAYESYYQLAMRTSGLKLLDFNPTSEFWVHTEILNNPAYNAQFIKSTYRDNEYCPPAAIAAIEARKDRDPNWYKVYGLGEIGSLEGLIFPTINIVQDIPHEFKRLGTGLDFGYTNDPTVAIDLYKSGDKILFDELFYQTGLLNSDIAKQLKQSQCFEVIADCAEPKSIDEIYRQSVNIKPASKGKDSVQFGIDLIKQHDIYVTARSINLIKEFRNYKWLTDKTGKALNIPVDCWNHAIDACRYIVNSKIGQPVICHNPVIF